MQTIQYSLVLKELKQEIDLGKPIAFLGEKAGLSEARIKSLLVDPPRVLLTSTNAKDVKKIQTTLKKMGCQTYVEPVIVDTGYSVFIPEKKFNVIKQELNKTQSSDGILAILLVQVDGGQFQKTIPSMLGDFEQKLAEKFREKDSVFGVDDNCFIIIGFSTSRENIGNLRDKITHVLDDLLGKEYDVNIGFSLFPEEGDSLPKLIEIAESRKEKDGKLEDHEQKSPETPYVLARDEGTLTPIQVCFTEARGKIFKRLLNMDPQSLLLGLSQLPSEKQKEFLARLPFESPLAPILQDAIESEEPPSSDRVVREDLETIVYYMEMEEGLEERKKNQEAILSALNRTESLPTLPSVATHVLMIASDPDASATDLTRVIINDPSLTSELLKVVNSAFYGFRQEISTVERAVILLGTGEIVALAFGLATAKLFNVTQLKGVYSPKSLWQHSMCTGLIAENLCKRFPEYKKLGVFTAGLLHDFGKIVLIEKFSDMYGKVHGDAKQHELPLFEMEDEEFGLNHAIIGEILASNWNLPDALVQAIAFHHQPFSAPSHSQLAAIIGLADYLYYEAIEINEMSQEFSGFSCELTSYHWTFLGQLFPGFDNKQLKEMTQDAAVLIKNSQHLFNI